MANIAHKVHEDIEVTTRESREFRRVHRNDSLKEMHNLFDSAAEGRHSISDHVFLQDDRGQAQDAGSYATAHPCSGAERKWLLLKGLRRRSRIQRLVRARLAHKRPRRIQILDCISPDDSISVRLGPTPSSSSCTSSSPLSVVRQPTTAAHFPASSPASESQSESLYAHEQNAPEAAPSPRFHAIQQWAAGNFIPNLVNDLPERFNSPTYDVCLSDFGSEEEVEAFFSDEVNLDEKVDHCSKDEYDNDYEPDDDDNNGPFIRERFTYTDGFGDGANSSQNEDPSKTHIYSNGADSILRYYEDADSAALAFSSAVQLPPVADEMRDQRVDASESILSWIAGVASALGGEGEAVADVEEGGEEDENGDEEEEEECEEGWREDFLGLYEASVRSDESESASSSSSSDALSGSGMDERAVQGMGDSILSWKTTWLHEGYIGIWDE